MSFLSAVKSLFFSQDTVTSKRKRPSLPACADRNGLYHFISGFQRQSFMHPPGTAKICYQLRLLLHNRAPGQGKTGDYLDGWGAYPLFDNIHFH
jgi:hypothetical protein